MNDTQQNPDLISRAGKIFLYSFIIFLTASALIAAISVLSARFSGFEDQALLTTSVIAAASICALCCSAYVSRSKNSLPGTVGIALTGVAAIMLIIAIWMESFLSLSLEYFKAAAVISVFAVAFAHTLALLAVRLRPSHEWLQLLAAINIFVLAADSSMMILNEFGHESSIKLLAVLAIFAALETLVIPILGRLAKAAPS